jgi:hypothetical protein
MTMIGSDRRHFLKTATAGLVVAGLAGCRSAASVLAARG